MNIKPIKDLILLRKVQQDGENLSGGGIVLPGKPEEEPVATVVATNASSELPVGAKVVYDRYRVIDTNLGDLDLMMVHEEDIFAVLENS